MKCCPGLGYLNIKIIYGAENVVLVSLLELGKKFCTGTYLSNSPRGKQVFYLFSTTYLFFLKGGCR